jgi:hypothetical protein
VPAEVSAPSEKDLEYPSFSIAGYMIAPTANMVTGEEPEIAANTAQDSIAATARPPGKGAVRTRIISISLAATDPWVITPPHKINSGIGSRISLSIAFQISSAI